MILENGTLQYEIIQGESDEDVVAKWSEPIRCCIRTNNDNKRTSYDDGYYRKSSFKVLFEQRNFPYKRVRLHRNGEFLGDFNIVSSEYLVSVGVAEIVV